MEDPYGVPTACARICFCMRGMAVWGERGVGEERTHTHSRICLEVLLVVERAALRCIALFCRGSGESEERVRERERESRVAEEGGQLSFRACLLCLSFCVL